jgi:hypothetical protein
MQLHETGATYPDPAGGNETRPVYRWYHKLGAVAGSVFCFELGAFLLIYPWISDWNVSAAYLPIWSRDIWTSAYFRGAVSGLGMLNLYISVV